MAISAQGNEALSDYLFELIKAASLPVFCETSSFSRKRPFESQRTRGRPPALQGLDLPASQPARTSGDVAATPQTPTAAAVAPVIGGLPGLGIPSSLDLSKNPLFASPCHDITQRANQGHRLAHGDASPAKLQIRVDVLEKLVGKHDAVMDKIPSKLQRIESMGEDGLKGQQDYVAFDSGDSWEGRAVASDLSDLKGRMDAMEREMNDVNADKRFEGVGLPVHQ
ncbi:hypothetical protein LTR36_003414 [Oleoguttula mirabilis]|uniref:Uncharacterized protein n=1 Tax=Oleoguttula mirabilis TaxID=1507867 RepID=A0AAV9JIJ3_9PEZI|nr:hypothetical protein LTR36_003414 [Oleoguttula mirabilis]